VARKRREQGDDEEDGMGRQRVQRLERGKSECVRLCAQDERAEMEHGQEIVPVQLDLWLLAEMGQRQL